MSSAPSLFFVVRSYGESPPHYSGHIRRRRTTSASLRSAQIWSPYGPSSPSQSKGSRATMVKFMHFAPFSPLSFRCFLFDFRLADLHQSPFDFKSNFLKCILTPLPRPRSQSENSKAIIVKYQSFALWFFKF
ncbi:hypothetical protein Bca52824_079219 [Brassica carinata]|uniref:Uncharacterized protein n=1 Tax=Brassica carinata TaxID=52824 RepID=A0A8X7PY56_BRACI|nr:hypothetical protein Bca52824_079219 [Brassica carinata]